MEPSQLRVQTPLLEEDKNEGSIPWQKTNPGLNIVWSQQNHMDRVIQPLLSMTKYHTAYCITLFGSYRSAKSPALAGMGFLCISCSGPCQHLSSGGCRGLLFSSCSTTSRGCLLCVPSVLPVASDAQLLRAAPTSQRCGYTHEQL
ncbi:uncharacterized protein LOC119141117 isoform X5 [Falco rusticolus]|uniref:uncharacterized protein LOC119141117 isoform X5 n=1 Tax=Falco rusticolus TaxID=120794 RepID=UPI000FFBC013|nr:uncharacterized protein LOC119141117 isoform X5 [Falco rusticolus]